MCDLKCIAPHCVAHLVIQSDSVGYQHCVSRTETLGPENFFFFDDEFAMRAPNQTYISIMVRMTISGIHPVKFTGRSVSNTYRAFHIQYIIGTLIRRVLPTL